MILHIDMDAFFASIEQAVNPRLKGIPLIVGSRDNKLYTVVCAASYEAKAFGIGSGMSSEEAFKICPNLEFVPAEQSKYIWTSEQIFGMLQGYGFPMNYASIDEFQLDIKEAQPKPLAEKIQKQIFGRFNITASIGVAKNWLLAKLASKLNKPNGIVIITEENLEEVLNKTPANKLCGIGKASQETLQSLSIQTCLELYKKTPQFLEKIFGKNGLNLYLELHSQGSLNDNEEGFQPKSVGHSYTFPRASKTPRFIQAWIRLLSEMVAERLRQQNLASQTTHLWLSGPEISNFSQQKTFQQTTNDGYEIYKRTLKIMVKLGPGMPKIRALGVSCSKLTQSYYTPLFNEQKKREEAIKAIDSINQRFGDNTIYPAVVVLTRKMQ